MEQPLWKSHKYTRPTPFKATQLVSYHKCTNDFVYANNSSVWQFSGRLNIYTGLGYVCVLGLFMFKVA